MRTNLILDCDSYKSSHYLMLPPDMDGATHYLEARQGGKYRKTLFFGLQYLLKEYLTVPVTDEDVTEAEAFFGMHGEPFPVDGWRRIVREHSGRLPIRIRAVPEGSIVPCGNVLMTVESTDPALPWLPGWLETHLMRVWYPTTVATRSHRAREIIQWYLEKTCDAEDNLLRFRLHCFGSRGTSSRESAMLGGAAHLVNFIGSDTVAGVQCANHYYRHSMAGFSVPAAEHSTILAWGKGQEAEVFAHILETFSKPGTVVSVPSDTYDIEHAISQLWGKQLLEKVRAFGGLLVIRLDSGEPAAQVVGTLRRLGQIFGITPNSKGYLVLNGIRILQGDGLKDEAAIKDILEAVVHAGYSTENIATLGMGGGLLQRVDRDTCRFAYKPCRVRRSGTWYPVRKEVISDPSKASKAGNLDLVIGTNLLGLPTYYTIDRDASPKEQREPMAGMLQALHGRDLQSELVTVFENGKLVKEWTLDEVRTRSREGEVGE